MDLKAETHKQFERITKELPETGVVLLLVERGNENLITAVECALNLPDGLAFQILEKLIKKYK